MEKTFNLTYDLTNSLQAPPTLICRFSDGKSLIVICFFQIGNGPSAIALSYMLAGNTPIYSGESNDEFLHLRLSEMPGYPIVLQDLKELSEVSFYHFFLS